MKNIVYTITIIFCLLSKTIAQTDTLTLKWEPTVNYGTAGQRTVLVNDTLWHIGGRSDHGIPFGYHFSDFSFIEYKSIEDDYWKIDTVKTLFRVFINAERIIDNELNSVSDNPLIFPNGKVMNSGHFHAEPIAQASDTLSIAMAEIGAIAERRIHFLMKGIDDQVPLFGAKEPGLESGFMLTQVTAAALASENKTLAHPASIDSISTSAGQEDFVSMAPWAAISCLKILKNIRRILAIELLVASNINYRFHKKYSSGNGLKPVMKLFQREKLLTKNDHILSEDLILMNKLIVSGKIIKNVKKVTNLV